MMEQTSRFTPLAITQDILSWRLPFGEDLFPSFYFSCQCVGKELFFCVNLQIPDKFPSTGRQGPDLVFSV